MLVNILILIIIMALVPLNLIHNQIWIVTLIAPNHHVLVHIVNQRIHQDLEGVQRTFGHFSSKWGITWMPVMQVSMIQFKSYISEPLLISNMHRQLHQTSPKHDIWVFKLTTGISNLCKHLLSVHIDQWVHAVMISRFLLQPRML